MGILSTPKEADTQAWGLLNLYTMETLKERAIQNLIYEQDFCGRSLSDNMVCRAYVKGATDQKATDIEKACEWLRIKKDWDEGCIEVFRIMMEE